MMRRLLLLIILANLMVMFAGIFSSTDNMLPTTLAAVTIDAGLASAIVGDTVELVNPGLKRIDRLQSLGSNIWLYPTVTAMDFGTLQYVASEGYFVGEYFFIQLMIPVTAGRPFTVTQSGTSIKKGIDKIADTAYVIIPDYNWLDEMGNPRVAQGSMPGTIPAHCRLGDPTTVTGSKTIYYDTIGRARIIRAIIAITGPLAGETKPRNWNRGFNGATEDPSGEKRTYDLWSPAGIDTPPGTYSADPGGEVIFTLATTG